MLRRLISAVFVIGLVLAFSGTATSDVVKGELNPVIKVDQNHERYVHVADARPAQPSFKKPESALRELPGGMTAPSTPASYFCDVQDYTNGAPYYFWPIPDAYGDDLFNMRFTSDAGYDCTLMVGHYLMYGTAMTGTPDLRCYLWDDDGFGFPDNKLDSVDILYASLPTSGIAYVSADFTPAGNASGLWWVFSDGEEYHLGWTILSSGPGDTLGLISDDATGSSSLEERASENWGGIWGTMLNDWGIDVSFFILAERCCSEIPYSDCYWQYYYTNAAYFWQAPHPTWGDMAYSMRMSVTQAETLQFVDVAVYDDGSGQCGNDDVIMTVYDDDGLGLPGTQIAQTTIAAGGYVFFPAWQRFNFGLVLKPAGMPGANLSGNSFHVAFSSSAILGSGDYECCLSSDGTDGVGRSASDWGGPYWVDMLTGWGVDCNFLFDAYLCKDPFKECYWDWCYNGLAFFWRLPDAWGDYAQAQKFTAQGEECQVHEVAWALYDNGTANSYTTTSEVQVYSDAGGLPGSKLAGITIGPSTAYPYVLYPSMMTVDFGPLNVLTTGDYWVAIESHGTDSTDGIRTLSDDVNVGGGGCVDSWAEYWGVWALMPDDWGFPARDAAAIVEERQCCIPYGGMTCYPSEDWPTYQRDYARTGHSMNAISDAWCDLTMYWNYEDPAQGVSWCGPIVAYDKVVQAFTDHYIVFDLNPASPPTASIVTTIAGFPLGGALRCTPTAHILASTGDTVLYVGGGDQQSFACYDLNSGALVWSRDIGTVGTAGLFGLTRWGRTVILDVGGMEVIYWGTDDGYVVAAEAANGTLYFGWGGVPTALTGNTFVSGATDGTNLFYGTYIGAGGPEGDVYSINAATGVINRQLSGPLPAGGLQGVNVFTHTNGYNGDEGFAGGIMYDNGKIYTNSRAEADHPTDGLFYSINVSDFSLNYAVVSNRAYYQTPIMDISHVYMPTTTRWGSPPAGGNMIKFNKNSGAIEGLIDGPGGGRYYAHDAAATCEPEPEPDFIVAVDDDGFLQFINTSDMSETFRRKIDNGIGWPYDMGQGVAVAHDVADEVHVLATCYWGNLIDLTKQADRARLEIQTYNPTTAVEFGSNTALPISIPDVFVNTGCIDLNFVSLCVDMDATACACDIQSPTLFASVSTVEADFMQRASRIADNLARDAYLSKYLRPSENVLDENLIISKDEMDLTKEQTNSAATAWPPYLVSLDFPYVGGSILPGDTADLDMTVNQPAISRGPQCFYVQLVTNDPDFYINNVSMDPCIYVCLVGGCLIDTTTLYFGMGCTDEELVTNTGRLGNGDWGDGPAGHNGFSIDGDGASYYQGAYVYATSTYRIAVHTQDWTSGGGEADAFVSMQPDPNWCDNECKPHLMSGVTLLGCMGGVGGVTSDGITYTPVVGDMVCKSFLDSVQNFGGDWANFGAPFDNDSTMGLYVESRVVGVCDVPELDNVTIEIMEFHNRNNDSVVGWYLGEIYDCDNGGDELGIDRDISTAWSYGGDQAWGQVKIPFGCVDVSQTAADNVPILNTWDEWGVSGAPGHGFWGWGIFWDSCYIKMARGVGHFSDGDIHGGDEEAAVTFASHDFGPYGDYEIAIARFALFGLADASDGAEYAGMAHMVNKFCGWERGDVNNDGVVGNLCDIIYLANFVNTGQPGPIPFMHLGDVVIDGVIDMTDVDRLIDYYFGGGPCPDGAWCF